MTRIARGTVASWTLLASLAPAMPAQVPTPPKSTRVISLPLRQVPSCVPKTITVHVRSGVSGGDGSSARPFRTIAEALGNAAESNVCAVVVEVGPGTYPELLEISRDSTLRGGGRDATVLRGSIEHRGGHRLVLERLSFRATSGPAVSAAHLSATTELREVSIDAASRYGIRQSGGMLTVTDVMVTETSGGPTLYDGSAIHADGGAAVVRANVSLRGNRHGVVAVGSTTKVTASRLAVSGGSSAYRSAESYDAERGRGLGAIEVRSARLLIEDSRISGDVGIGILVGERGSLHARRVVLEGTQRLPSADRFRSWGGIGLLLHGSLAELSDVTIGDGLIGAHFWESGFKATRLRLRDLELGVGFTTTDDPNRVAECLGDVQAERVERVASLQRPDLILPGPGPTEISSLTCLFDRARDECRARYGTFRPCARVPWD